MDEGWTRWVLEQYGFAYVTLHPEDFKSPLDRQGRRADPGRRCAAADRSGRGRGGRGGAVAAAGPVARSAPSTPIGCRADDLAAFEQFVRGGGTLVCLNNASNFAIQQFKLPVKNVVAGLRPEEFFLRGTIVEVTTDPTQPVMAGHAGEGARCSSTAVPVFETQDGFKGHVLARYQDSGSPLLSGYLIGEKSHARQGRGARRAARRGPRRPARLPAGVARPAVRHVQGAVQRSDQRRAGRAAP